MIKRGMTALALALALAAGPASAASADCDRTCLNSVMDGFVAALAKRDPAAAPVAPNLRYTENLVPLRFGQEGLWRTISGKGNFDIHVADVETGSANWIGIVNEMGKPVFVAIRLKVENRRATEAEMIVGRVSLQGADKIKGPRPEFAQVEPPQSRISRDRLIAIVDSHWTAMETGKASEANYHADCVRYDNGALTTGPLPAPKAGEPAITDLHKLGCHAQLASGRFHNGNQVKPRRVWGVDEERQLVIGYYSPNVPGNRESVTVFGQEVKVGWDEKIPFTIQQTELFKVVDGKIKSVEVVLGPRVPFGMRGPFDMETLWKEKEQ